MNKSLPFVRKIQMTIAEPAEVREVVVQIGLPERDPLLGGDFRVLVEIAGFDEPYSSFIHGVDELHAFLSACWLLTEILPSFAPEGARLIWLGDADLGFGISSATPE